MKKAIKIVCAFLTAVSCGIFGVCAALQRNMPNDFTAYNSEKIVFNDFLSVAAAGSENNEVAAAAKIGDTNTKGNLMLLNIIPIKSVNVHTVQKKKVVPCGKLFGIKFHTKGVAVISCDSIGYGENKVNPGENAGIKPGDTILSVNGNSTVSCEEMRNTVAQSLGQPLNITLDRQGNQLTTTITPAMCDGEYHLGLWIKDSCAGLGTMTFYDEESGVFASLGHGICDNDTGELLLLDSADITPAEIASITKGSNGAPGSINGYFSDEASWGHAEYNSETGLYGTLYNPISNFAPVEIANIQDVKKGSAYILCALDGGEPNYYSIEITNVNYDERNKTKNLQILATDNRLLEKTGGIVQGMSGSPILQNGKIVGAVTHVLVTNSAKGYGIFAQNMADDIDNFQN